MRNYDKSIEFTESIRRVVPGGCHTYAKGEDQYPEAAPNGITHGEGCRIWDLDGNEYIEYGMGLRTVTLGHAYPEVVEAAAAWLGRGQNFNRPASIELEAAEKFLSLYPQMDMVKFCKDGSVAVDGAVKLARAATGRTLVAIPSNQPFFSSSDWFTGSLVLNAGVPEKNHHDVVKFTWNDVDSVEQMFRDNPGQIALVLMEPGRAQEPDEGFLHAVRDIAHRNGALFVLDEMVTGFRWDVPGATKTYDIVPDLSTFGKALGNGFAVSALVGKREYMEIGGMDHEKPRAWLLSTTHGAENHALAAAVATMGVYEREDVTGHLDRMGERLRAGVQKAASDLGLSDYWGVVGRGCSVFFYTQDHEGKGSQPFRTLFIQEMLERGVVAPSFIISYSHEESDVDETIEAVRGSLEVYGKAIEAGSVEGLLRGRSVAPVYRRYA